MGATVQSKGLANTACLGDGLLMWIIRWSSAAIMRVWLFSGSGGLRKGWHEWCSDILLYMHMRSRHRLYIFCQTEHLPVTQRSDM